MPSRQQKNFQRILGRAGGWVSRESGHEMPGTSRCYAGRDLSHAGMLFKAKAAFFKLAGVYDATDTEQLP